ncbi:phosphatase PAP2 family protein [Cellulomonas carbonis]|uniref:PA-phosphatase n=1 Tax=Cellulomonas carbonis T26 TaxID=947969 RepID=A0A0A0BT76_9CELL|nr:phosphatase PAP2 family protein [Cellulomonas carbonis]KGM10349.1 PA-phosphatase [Cellulomonas carbonis T26]GGC04432.1 hypothetical protein GCM10010972_17020 [Cellulomonas carbonis]
MAPVTPPRPVRPVRSGRRAPALVTAALAGAGVLALWYVFVATHTGQVLEAAAFQGSEYGASRLWRVAEPVLDVISVPFIAIVLVSAMLVAVVRRRAVLAIQVAVVTGGANLTTQLLKHSVLDKPDHGVGDRLVNTLPSGHTTAAASVAAALLFVVPRRFRPVTALLGAAYTAATGVSTLVGQWHRPSDAVAGVLVVVAWAGVAAALDVDGRPAVARRSAVRGATLLVLLGGGAVAAAGALVALVRSRADLLAGDELDSRLELLQAYGGGTLGVLAAAAVGFALVLLVVDAAEARWATAGPGGGAPTASDDGAGPPVVRGRGPWGPVTVADPVGRRTPAPAPDALPDGGGRRGPAARGVLDART